MATQRSIDIVYAKVSRNVERVVSPIKSDIERQTLNCFGHKTLLSYHHWEGYKDIKTLIHSKTEIFRLSDISNNIFWKMQRLINRSKGNKRYRFKKSLTKKFWKWVYEKTQRRISETK
jgi:hypothetical protein